MEEVKKVSLAIKAIQREIDIMKAFLQIMEEKDSIDIKTLGVKKMGVVSIVDKAREIISSLEKENPNIFKERYLISTGVEAADFVANDMKKSVDRVVDTMVDIHRAVMVEPKKKK